VAGAKVAASGPVRIETETNAEGRYTFLGMAPGMYTIEATFSGLEAVHGVRVLAKQPAEEHVQHDSERQRECVKLPISRHVYEPAVSFAWFFSACSSDCLAETTVMSSAHS
jgi:hypothetical protein